MALRGIPILLPGETSGRINMRFERSAKRLYRCYADPNDSEYQVMNALPPGLAILSRDPGYQGFVVTDVEVSDREKCTWPSTDGGDDTTLVRIWHAAITYEPFSPLLNAATGNPLDQPPRFRFACTRGSKILDKDTDGEQITNSAGDAYDPPVERNTTSVVLIVNRNELAPDFPTVLGWCDKINESDWNTFPARTLLIAPINLPAREYDQNADQLYYPMEYQFEYNPDTWDKMVLDAGTREFDPNTSPPGLKDILIQGQPATEACLLNGSGRYLPPPVAKDDVVYRKVKAYDTLDFSLLNLDNLFETPNAPPPSGGGGGE